MSTPKMNVADLDRFLRSEFSEFYAHNSVTIETADGTTCRIRQRFQRLMLRPGGTISGPALMTLADFAMYAAILSRIGPVALAVTTNLNINFLRKAPAGRDLIGEARLLKAGRRLAVGDVQLLSDGSFDLVAHATCTYAIPSTR